MRDFVDRHVGRLLALALVLALVTGVAIAFVPQVVGFDWVGPVKLLQGVVVRRGFASVVAVAWVFGRASWLARQDNRSPKALFPGFWDRGRLGTAIVTGGIAAALAGIGIPTYHVLDVAAVGLLVTLKAAEPPRAGSLRDGARDMGRAILLFVAASYVFTVVKAFLFVGNEPRDAAILAFESRLFGTPIHHHVVGWVNARPTLADAFDEVYFMLFEHMTVASVFLVAAGRSAERLRLWSALALAYLIGGPAYYLLPALGPAFFEPKLYAQIAERHLLSREIWEVLLANTDAMRARRPIELTPYSFIACMPSLHLAHETVMLWYARSSRPFFLLSLLFTLATCLAVMALGWHYFIDIFGGLALGALSIAIVERLGPGLPVASAPRQDDRQDDREGEAAAGPLPPLAGWAPFVVGPVVLLGPALFGPLILEDRARVFRPGFVTAGLGHSFTEVTTTAIHALEGVRSYRPLTELLDWLAILFLGQEPRAHHLASVLLLGLCSWLIVRLLERAGVSPTTRWTAAALIAVHPVSLLAAGYVSARVWLVGTAVALAIVDRLLAGRADRLALALAGGGVAILGSLHEGLAFAGLATTLGAPATERGSRRRALGVAVLALALVTAARRHFVGSMPLLTELRDAALALSSSLGALGSLAIDGAPSPGLAIGPGSALGFGVALASLAALATLLEHPRFTATGRARLLGVSCALPLAILAGFAVAAANGRGVSGAAAFPALVGVVMAVALLLDERATRLATTVSPSLQRGVRFLPLLVLLAGVPLAWASLSSMKSAPKYAVELAVAHPNDARTLLLAGSVLAEGANVAEGAAACKHAEEQGIPSDDVTYCLALATASTGDPAAAHARLAAHPRLEESREARHLLVLTMLGAGDVEGAQAETSRLLERYPDDAKLRRLATAIQNGAMPPPDDDTKPASRRGHFGTSPTR